MSPFFFLNARLTHKLMRTADFEALINSMPDIAKRYRSVESSDMYKEYRSLEMSISTDFFRSQKEKTLKQKNGKQLWAESEEGKQEARFQELKKNADILFYLATDAKQIRQAEALQPVFEDHFGWTKLEDSQWKSGFLYPSKDFVANHSYTNELQAYTDGKNVKVANGQLVIETRKEIASGPAWDPKKGMVMHQFQYTSGALHAEVPISRDGGMAIIKARCTGSVNHGVYLRGKKHLPMLFLFDFTGKRLYTGIKTEKDGDKHMLRLNGLPATRSIIYTVTWDRTNINWFINNMLIHTAPNTLPMGEDMYLHLYSCLFAKNRGAEGTLEIDWVRCYNVKKA